MPVWNEAPDFAAVQSCAEYVTYLFEEGAVNCDITAYLSAINTRHRQLGLAAPAVGFHFTKAKQGFARLVASTRGKRLTRLPLPARVVRRALQLGLRLVRAGDVRLARACAIVVHAFMFFGRSDSVVDVTLGAVSLDAVAVAFREDRFKGRSHEPSRFLRRPRRRDDECPVRLLQQFAALRRAQGADDNDLLFRLPSDAGAWGPTRLDSLLQVVLAELQVHAPAGASYTSHSLRAGAATAALSIGVPEVIICRLGGWVDGSRSVHRYLDPTVPPDDAAFLFFGWLLPGHTEFAATGGLD